MARPRAFDEAEVLDRATDVFWRLGYEGASMAELTKAMGSNSPTYTPRLAAKGACSTPCWSATASGGPGMAAGS